jgi:hypothetical protein
MDVNGIGTMGNFGEQTPVAIGSVAKAMTAYIVLKDHPLKAARRARRSPSTRPPRRRAATTRTASRRSTPSRPATSSPRSRPSRPS